MELPAGSAPLALTRIAHTAFTLVFKPRGEPSLPDRALIPVLSQRATPTRYHVPSITGPGFLVFSEGYHPGWQARRHQETLPHVAMQGFANAFWVPPGPAAPVEIRFRPQAWFRLGVVISLGTLAALATSALAAWRHGQSQVTTL